MNQPYHINRGSDILYPSNRQFVYGGTKTTKRPTAMIQ